MKIVEQDNFFEVFQQAMSFPEWIKTYQKEESISRLQEHIKQSGFLKKKFSSSLKELDYKLHILVIVADWCGDCHRSAPVLKHVADLSEFIELKFLNKEDHMDLLRTTNGGEKIPYVMVFSKDGFFINDWVERSYEAYKYSRDAMKKFNYEKSKDFFNYYIKTMKKRNKEIYKTIADEFVHEILKANAIQGTSPRINKK